MNLGYDPCPTSAASWEEELDMSHLCLQISQVLQKGDVSRQFLPSFWTCSTPPSCSKNTPPGKMFSLREKPYRARKGIIVKTFWIVL